MTTIETLTAEWLECKRREAEANQKRVQIEKEICAIARERIPTEGSVTLGSIKVTTGYDRKWDKDILTEIHRTKPTIFPFAVDWKEDRRLTKKLELENKEAMIPFSIALTIYEKKPYFALAKGE